MNLLSTLNLLLLTRCYPESDWNNDHDTVLTGAPTSALDSPTHIIHFLRHPDHSHSPSICAAHPITIKLQPGLILRSSVPSVLHSYHCSNPHLRMMSIRRLNGANLPSVLNCCHQREPHLRMMSIRRLD
jgi:hypothetical protein